MEKEKQIQLILLGMFVTLLLVLILGFFCVNCQNTQKLKYFQKNIVRGKSNGVFFGTESTIYSSEKDSYYFEKGIKKEYAYSKEGYIESLTSWEYQTGKKGLNVTIKN